MLGNFTYHNATKVHFGKDALGLLGDELKNYGPKVMLSYGGGSIKRFGIYDQVVKVLREAGKTIIEDGGVLPNPDIEKVLEGARKVREEGVDLILASVAVPRPTMPRRSRPQPTRSAIRGTTISSISANSTVVGHPWAWC